MNEKVKAYINLRHIPGTLQFMVFATIENDKYHKKLHIHTVDIGDALKLMDAVNSIIHSLNLIGVNNITDLTKRTRNDWNDVLNKKYDKFGSEDNNNF